MAVSFHWSFIDHIHTDTHKFTCITCIICSAGTNILGSRNVCSCEHC